MKREQKLAILIYAIAFATLVFIIILAFILLATTQDIKALKESVQRIENSTVIPINGIDGVDGKDGYTPMLNKDYFNGINGKDSISTKTTIIKEVPVKGDKGEAGVQLEIQVDPQYCVLMTRYQGDEAWIMQAQLPKPCEVL